MNLSTEEFLESQARNFVVSIPEEAIDNGFFGPGSVAWKLHRDFAMPVAGIRALMLQALHPLVMAGVAQHSNWRDDMFGRLASTSKYITTVTYGDTITVENAAAKVRQIHQYIMGTDSVTNKSYAANDPALLLWVHAATVDSVLIARSLYGEPLADADRDRYVAEMVVFAKLVGVPQNTIPRTAQTLNRYIEETLPELMSTKDAGEAISTICNPPELSQDLAEIWTIIAAAALSSLPSWAAEMYGDSLAFLPAAQPKEVAQALGIFDLQFESYPGVIEMRDRITVLERSSR